MCSIYIFDLLLVFPTFLVKRHKFELDEFLIIYFWVHASSVITEITETLTIYQLSIRISYFSPPCLPADILCNMDFLMWINLQLYLLCGNVICQKCKQKKQKTSKNIFDQSYECRLTMCFLIFSASWLLYLHLSQAKIGADTLWVLSLCTRTLVFETPEKSHMSQ